MTSEFLTCRRVLAFMVIACFMIQYMLRVNLSIAIVEMVRNSSNSSDPPQNYFAWTEEVKHDVLGCFFWGYTLTTIPGGRLSEIYGTRIVMGSAMLVSSILTLLTPFASNLHYYGAIASRTLLGLALGVAFPALPPMVAKWIPVSDRSKFMSHSAAGFLGAAFTLPLCGFLIAHFGWPSAFYVTGAIGLVFSLAWFYLVYDSPDRHPRISESEREELRRELRDAKEKKKIPWAKILTSGPVWAITMVNTFVLATLIFIQTEIPLYMKEVLDFGVQENGLLLSIPSVVTYASALFSSFLADRWIRSERFSIITVRKFFTGICALGPALFLSVQALWGYNPVVSVMVFTFSLGCMGCFSPGYMSNTLDIAPSYSGTVYAFGVAIGGFAGYISTKILSLALEEKQTFEQWRYIFWILVAVNVFGAVFYFIFASGEVQSWNPKSNESEMEKLCKRKSEKI